MGNAQFKIKLILSHLTVAFLLPLVSLADVVIFKNGDQLEVDKAWEKSDRVFINFQGLKASIVKKEVLRIDSKKNDQSTQSSVSQKSVTKTTLPDKTSATVENYPKKIQPPEDIYPPDHGMSAPISRQMDGFRDLRWGVNLKDLMDFEKLGSDTDMKDVQEYIRANEHLKIGDVELQSIVYAFWRDRLYTITVWTQGYSSYTELRHEAFKLFGTGDQDDQSGEKYLWSDDSTDRMLQYVPEGQLGILWMRSKKMDRVYKMSEFKVPSSYLKWMKLQNTEKR